MEPTFECRPALHFQLTFNLAPVCGNIQCPPARRYSQTSITGSNLFRIAPRATVGSPSTRSPLARASYARATGNASQSVVYAGERR